MENNKNRVKWFSLASIWFGGIVSVPSLLIGSTLVASLGFSYTILAGLIGFTFVVFFMSLLSVAAVEQRKSTVSLAASSFGQQGSKILIGLIIGLSTLGWFGVQTSIAGESFSNILREAGGFIVPSWISSIFWGIIMVLTAVFGFKYLKWLNYIAVPAIVLLLTCGVFITLQTHSFSEIFAFKPNRSISLLQAIGFTIGFVSVGGVISPDYNRFSLNKKHAVLGSIAGIIPSALLLLGIGAMLAITQGTFDIVAIFSTLGFPFLAMSTLILATWTSNVINVYSSGLAFTNLGGLAETSRSKITLLAGGGGLILAAIGIMDHFMDFITALTITITPVAGVIISDYFICRTYKEVTNRFNWTGILSWGCGVATMLLMDSEIKYILGIMVATLSYWILTKLTDANLLNFLQQRREKKERVQ